MRNYLLISLAAHLAGALVIGAVGAFLHQPLQPVEVIRVDLATLPSPPRPKKKVTPPPSKPVAPVKKQEKKTPPVPPAPKPVERARPEPEMAPPPQPEPATPVEKLPSAEPLPTPPREEPRVVPPPARPSAEAADDLDFLEPEEVEPEVQAAEGSDTPAPADEPAAPAAVQVEKHSGLPDYYVALVQRKIDRRWEPSAAGVRGGPSVSCLIRFRIAASGVIENPRVVEGSGFSVFDREALRAVISASPLPPPPAGSKVMELPINVRFHLER